ncbi:hypothetical protein [Flavobacterium taihuense]|uniref:Transporter n=1 Tax=Flavobacterium taihuense TaxID=2857508 RepID=A0ABS6XVF5_9FLAO|nr:hypothetical protein [Flavobacterium taihuense]MBW4360655.1 hypothetical protein [Flavobacterium taihuense]
MRKLLYIMLVVFGTTNANAQGCSDAGICSIGHAFDTSKKTLKNNIEVAAIFGKGEADVAYFSPFVSYTRKITEKLSLSSKIVFSSASGSFGTSASFGDAFLIGNYTFKEKKNKQWSTLFGWKFPFTSSNKKINGYSLPLDYQASLGTFDLFLGTNLKYRKWNFNTAVQIPVFNNNKNSYFKEFSGTDDFPSTNLFQRKSDALVSASYSIVTKNEKFTFKPNVIFIYHLGEDSYETIIGKRENIIGSDGLTINGNLITAYNINKKNTLELAMATPFVVRTVRPDGLTRSFVASIIYKMAF